MTGRIVIADDHPLFRSALAHAVGKVWEGGAIIEASSAVEARSALAEGAAEALLLDLHMADSSGLSVLMDLRQDYPALPIVIVSASEEPRVAAAAQLGAAGFIPKSASLEAMREGLAAVRDGDAWFPESAGGADDDLARIASLTPAQRRILAGIRQGLLNKQIAYELAISEATVKAHITAILRKLGVGSRTQAVLLAAKLDVDQPVADPARA